MNLSQFQKPSRYINRELNSVRRNAPVSVALAFPDIYDVGMSHLGLRILYAVINDLPYAFAERVFSPWPDFEESLKKTGGILASLESDRPLKDFDIVGFSLQYELCYTTVLNMLSLGGIPLRTEERLTRGSGPIIIAGGPCTVNPFPMAPFIDAFLVGDGEEAVPEILEACYRWKEHDARDRLGLLSSLSEIHGVFVPSLGRDRSVRRRYIASLEDAPFPVHPIVPFTNIIHDRVNIEISRGCTMGCRFCQAGMIYRPARERSPEKILRLAEKSLKSTGYDTASFTSLSSGDYSCLPYLMKEFNGRFSSKRISLSLPSLRVATVNRDMLRELKAVRKSGFTMAPEAGTDRLRAVINKDFTEELYTSALESLFSEGWQNLKLYFMIGLPTETDEDLAAIHDMVFQAIRISKKLTGRHATVSVGVSPFVPKPHTPFQWYGQNSLRLLHEKVSLVKKSLLRRGIQFKGHNPEMSVLEAAFARGDETLGALVEAAWKLGCRLDAWTDIFDSALWMKAMDITGVDAHEFAERSYAPDSRLPWDPIESGIARSFLWKEYQRALSGKFTIDCKKQCHVCGLQCPAESGHKALAPALSPDAGAGRPTREGLHIKVRLEFSKTDRARYLSHLETTTALIRAMRRADFPFKYSEGFHPAPRVSFGPALGVGIGGLKEYLDIDLLPPFDPASGLRALQQALPEGLAANRMQIIPQNEKSLNSFIVRYTYEIKGARAFSLDRYPEVKDRTIQRKNGYFLVKDMVEEIKKIDDVTARLTVRDLGETKVRIDELISVLFDQPAEDLSVTRTSMTGLDGIWKEPMEDALWAAKS